MTTKSSSVIYDNQKTFPIVTSITQLAHEMIKKRPGIYKGNLVYWLLEKIPKSTRIDVELAFLQLLKEGYFFSIDDSVYPPNKVDENVKTLTKFVSVKKLSFTDYGILYELYKTKNPFKQLSEFSRKVISQGWSENEKEVKNKISELFLKNIITEKDGNIAVNWKLIHGVLQ